MAIYNGTQKVKPSGIAKVYVGSQLVYESTPTPIGPSKGDIISFDAFGDGNQKRFRVLAINGNIAKLLALNAYQTGLVNIYGSATLWDDGGWYCGNYDGSNIDTLLNTTYYNALSATTRNAIVQSTNLVQSA